MLDDLALLFDKYNIPGAFGVTVQLTVYSAIGSLLWGTVLVAMRVSPVPVMRWFATGYINVVRNTPLTVIIVATSLGLWQTMGVTLAGGRSDVIHFRLAILGLVAYTACFVCESLRSGINTVHVGQAEAARALGLNFLQVLGLIVLPQAFRSVIGPLASVLIALTKNTTIASAIGVAQAAATMKTMIEFDADLLYLIIAIVAFGFVLLTLPTGLILGWVAKKVAVKR